MTTDYEALADDLEVEDIEALAALLAGPVEVTRADELLQDEPRIAYRRALRLVETLGIARFDRIALTEKGRSLLNHLRESD